ncbi:MAG: hypothetical protein KC731_28290, partial [Myxococcales bacterium]|nr:hypothetical protein [Myxococcales bacterium]
MRLKNVMPVVVALVSAACAVGDAPPADENPQTTVQAASGGPGWSPHSPWTKQQLENLCDDPEWFPSTPPEMGKCTIEVRLTESSFVNGQGVSEGRGEISLVATADPLDTAGLPTTLAATGIEIYNPEQTNSQSLNLGTYEVAVGSQERVRVCVDFTEHDGGGANGGDDLATGCTTLVLRCSGQDLNGDSVPDGFAGASGTVGPVQLCGDNQCNGWVSAGVEALAADADMDGVENDEDFTPELCDEAEKGENGLGLITYYHFGDDWLTSLFQGIGTGVASTYAPYDFVILVSDQDASNPANVNAAMFRNADLVLPPTRDGLMDAMREMTRRGLRFDMNVFSHGHGSGPDDADFETISGGQITGDWLVGAAQPDQTGTPFGGIPLMAWWSTTCIAARQIDAWIDIGGIVASGAVNIQFNANTLGSYFGAWSGG